MPHLPQELIDETIGHLWDDFPSLLSCSLSCRAWLPSARTHIFRDQFLASAGDCDRFEQLLEASSDIAGYVRKLSVSEPQNVFYAEAWIARLPSLMAKLENLEHIEFAKLHWSSQNMPRAYAKGASVFPVLARVRCIILSDVSFDTVAEVYDLLAQSPNLRDLCYRRISCQDTTSYMVDASVRLDCRNRVPPRLQGLLLDAWTSAGTVIEWFLAANELELRSLVVRWRDHGNINVLSRLLRACAESLEHFQIEFPSTMTEAGDINLAFNKALRVLHIDGLVLLGCCNWVTTLLSQVDSNRLEKLSISMIVLREDALRCLEWVDLDRVLSRPQFSGLELTFNINLAINPINDKERVPKLLQGYLPAFQERGKLVIACR